MNQPRLSIITPVYNGERFIEACLKRVVEQNCSDVEHIIMDGCSEDRTVEIVRKYAQKYSHIRIFSKKDAGQADAMNNGVREAKAKILGFLNVDDFYEPHVLNRILEIFLTLPEPSFLVGNCNVLNDEGAIIKINKPSKLRLRDLLLGFYINETPCNPTAYFYHKSLHDVVGFYNSNELYSMDTEFILRAVQGATVEYVDETWGNFLKHRDTKTMRRSQLEVIFGRERLYNQCVLRLPLHKQVPLWGVRSFGFVWACLWTAYVRVKFFARHPNELLKSIKKKINA